MAMMGFAEMLSVLLMFGGIGLPVGIPPGEVDPRLAHVAPEECLAYVSWAGTAAPDPASGNSVEQLLAEPEVQQAIEMIVERLKQSFVEEAEKEGEQMALVAEYGPMLVETLLTRPTALYLASLDPNSDPAQIDAGMIVNLGDRAAQVKKSLQTLQQQLLGPDVPTVEIGRTTFFEIQVEPDAPVIQWAVRGPYLLVGVGEGAAEGMLKRAATPAPGWMAEIDQRLAIPRRGTVSYVNVGAIIQQASAGNAQVEQVLDAVGLGNLQWIGSASGLDETSFISRTLIATDGPPEGLLAQLAARPLTAKELSIIPHDATIAATMRLNGDMLLETILSTVRGINPQGADAVNVQLAAMGQALGLDVRKDVLQSLGDAWCVYNAPSEGGLVITGLTAAVEVRDHDRLSGALDKLMAMLQQATSQPGSDAKIRTFEFAGETIYYLDVDEMFPLAPAWCLTETHLLAATFPQQIKAFLSRDEDFQSLATRKEVADLLADQGPSAMSYYDTQAIFRLVYPFVPMIARVASVGMRSEGFDFDMALLPSAAAIDPHLRPGVGAVVAHENGVELFSRQSVPGSNLTSVMGVGAGLLMPAVSSARSAARRVQGTNNLRQIGLALTEHIYKHGYLPPPFSVDDDGKPLLSWRVHLLPYIEEQALYERFHLDEPWDSEHNRELIPLMPDMYRSPTSGAEPGRTNYLVPRGEETLFPDDKKIRPADIQDGMSRTIMVVEAGDAAAVIWTKPDDFDVDRDDVVGDLIGLHPSGFNALIADGSVRFIVESIDLRVLDAMFTRAGGETVEVP